MIDGKFEFSATIAEGKHIPNVLVWEMRYTSMTSGNKKRGLAKCEIRSVI